MFCNTASPILFLRELRVQRKPCLMQNLTQGVPLQNGPEPGCSHCVIQKCMRTVAEQYLESRFKSPHISNSSRMASQGAHHEHSKSAAIVLRVPVRMV